MRFRTSLVSVIVVAALAMFGGCDKGEEVAKEKPTAESSTPKADAPESGGSGVPAAISATFKADGCCDKAEKAGTACDHKCCIDAVAAGKACEKCNKA